MLPTQDLLNIMLAERALLSVNGYLGGPSLRCRTTDRDHSLIARKVADRQQAPVLEWSSILPGRFAEVGAARISVIRNLLTVYLIVVSVYRK